MSERGSVHFYPYQKSNNMRCYLNNRNITAPQHLTTRSLYYLSILFDYICVKTVTGTQTVTLTTVKMITNQNKNKRDKVERERRRVRQKRMIKRVSRYCVATVNLLKRLSLVFIDMI